MFYFSKILLATIIITILITLAAADRYLYSINDTTTSFSIQSIQHNKQLLISNAIKGVDNHNNSISNNHSNFIINYNTDNFHIANIVAKKINVGDIKMAYKTFGNGPPIILVSGSANVMDVWPSYFLQELSKNHKVVIFDNRGVGNTTAGTKPFSIVQFANDTAGLRML
jgi:hypothetical protein